MRYIYISGSIAGDPNARERFGKVADEIRRYGDNPINPFDIGNYCGRAPCDTAPDKHDWSCHLRWDLQAMLDKADGIFMLYGWEKSHGARLEHLVAAAVGIPIAYENPPQKHIIAGGIPEGLELP